MRLSATGNEIKTKKIYSSNVLKLKLLVAMCVAGKMRLVNISGILILMFMLGNAKKKHRILGEGDGLHFPQRPLPRTVAERYVRCFNSFKLC